MALNEIVGKRLREIRGDRTQEKFVKKLDLIPGISRSHYSMIEIGKRPANIKLLDMISDNESVSFDYIFGLIDHRIDVSDNRYHKLLELWSIANNKKKDMILKNIEKIMKEEVI